METYHDSHLPRDVNSSVVFGRFTSPSCCNSVWILRSWAIKGTPWYLGAVSLCRNFKTYKIAATWFAVVLGLRPRVSCCKWEKKMLCLQNFNLTPPPWFFFFPIYSNKILLRRLQFHCGDYICYINLFCWIYKTCILLIWSIYYDCSLRNRRNTVEWPSMHLRPNNWGTFGSSQNSGTPTRPYLEMLGSWRFWDSPSNLVRIEEQRGLVLHVKNSWIWY